MYMIFYMENFMTTLERSIISDEEFINKIIIPSHFQAALHDSCSFGIRDRREQILICSNDYARDIGYHNFKDAMLKRPDYDFKRRFGSIEYFNIQMNFLINNKKSFHYTYRNKKNNTSNPHLHFVLLRHSNCYKF